MTPPANTVIHTGLSKDSKTLFPELSPITASKKISPICLNVTLAPYGSVHTTGPVLRNAPNINPTISGPPAIPSLNVVFPGSDTSILPISRPIAIPNPKENRFT